MVYTLSVFERLIILNILPSEGNITTLRIVRDLKTSLSFSEDEHKKLEINVDQSTGIVKWKTEAEHETKIEIGVVARKIISNQLKELSEKNKLNDQHIGLYDKFVEE